MWSTRSGCGGCACRSAWGSGARCAPVCGTRRARVMTRRSVSTATANTAPAIFDSCSRRFEKRARTSSSDRGSRRRMPTRHSPPGASCSACLGLCLTALTGRRVTDATSGFWAIGPRALRLLAEHHPTGYPEPELRLFLDRNGLQAVEVPVHARSRQGGRTSLTPFRITAAGARFLLAMIVVPFREGVGRHDRD